MSNDLLEKYFEAPQDSFIEEHEAVICSVSYCSEIANDSGYCSHHEALSYYGLQYESQKEEDKVKYNSLTRTCLYKDCDVDIDAQLEYCYHHAYQLKRYGFATTTGQGHHFVDKYFGYSVMKVWQPIKQEWLEIKLDHEDAQRFKKYNIRLNSDGDAITDVVIDGVTKERPIKFLLSEQKSGMILWNIDGDKINICRKNLEWIDRKSHFFLVWGGKPGVSGYRGIRWVKRKKGVKSHWLLTMFYDKPDLKIVRKFKRIKDAVRFRNIVYNEYYHPRMGEMVQKYYEEKKIYGL